MNKDTKEMFTGKNFKWSKVLSGFNSSKTREEKELQFASGLPGHVPYESDMIKEWQPPFLFYKFFIYCFVMMVLIFVCSYMYGVGNSLLVSLVPYMMPVTLLVFIWELNVPRNISILEIFGIVIFSGIICYFVIFFIRDITGIDYTGASVFTMPLLAIVAKTLLLCVFLRKKSRGYALNGFVIGAAVGAGYAILCTADDLFYVAEYAGQITGVMGLVIVKVIMVIGGDIIWTAAIGGALAMAKGKEALKGKHLGNSLFLICLIGSYFIEVLWNYDITDFFIRFADSKAAVGLYTFLYTYQGKYILLTVVSWSLFLFIGRKGMEQAIDVANGAAADKKKWDSKIAATYAGKAEIFGISGVHGGKKFVCSSKAILFGRDNACDVKFAQDAGGISSNHCEIRKQGEDFVLIDSNSSYGTFWINGERLTSGQPYTLQDGAGFYLADEGNSYKVSIKREQNAALKEEMYYGRRTNEIDGVEETGQNVYIACAVVLAVMFLAFFMTSNGTAGFLTGGVEESLGDTSSFYGAWTADTAFNIKDIILKHIDDVFSVLDIGIFKDSYANGITFTQDGMAYCTYNGAAIDYAKFTYSVVDDSTLFLQFTYESFEANAGVDASVGVASANAGISSTIGDETGFNVKYEVDGNEMRLNFAGQNLVLYK